MVCISFYTLATRRRPFPCPFLYFKMATYQQLSTLHPSRPRGDTVSSERSNTSSPDPWRLSRETTAQDNTEYDSSRYNSLPDVERKGLVSETPYKRYKRRYFGLAEITLLNFAVGWGYTAPGVISSTAKDWYGISFAELNYLSVASSLIFLVPAPFTIWTLNRYGPKFSIIFACIFTVIGNWIIYAGAKTHNFPVNIFGTIVHSIALPFVLAMPTRYSRQWFGDRGRTLATALPSLAYPLGSGIGALSGAYMVKPLGPFSKYSGQLRFSLVF